MKEDMKKVAPQLKDTPEPSKPNALEHARDVKMKALQLLESCTDIPTTIDLLEKAIKIYEKHTPNTVLLAETCHVPAIVLKGNLAKWDEAQALYTKAIIVLKEAVLEC